MLKITGLSDKPAPSKNDGSRSAFGRNNDNEPIFGTNNGNNKFDGINIGCDSMKHTKKSEKSKGKKLSKSQKLAKSRKHLSKSENSPNFDAKNNEPSFLTAKARTAFNHLWLIFIEGPIL